jgi:Uma2 family endonuclease
MSTLTRRAATLDDLLKVEGKAELIAGRIVHFMASGALPSSVAFEIAVGLREYARREKRGKAFADGIGYALPTPLAGSGRESFSPDASFYDGQLPLNPMRFIDGVPLLAVEVRSENDYGPKAEREMAEKREDYALAGTQVIWDVDPVAESIAKYDATNLAAPTIFHRGEVADAEPALPGWRLNVDDVFAVS